MLRIAMSSRPPKLLAIFVLFSIASVAQSGSPSESPTDKPRARITPAARVCPRCIRAHMDFLASDALRGRGSGTQDEWIAATYVASQLEQYGVEPAGDGGTYIQ